jgi:acetyl esterase/lipase
MAAIAVDLCDRGFAVWNIGYRRVGEPGGGWPGTLDDVVAALACLETIASDDATPLDLQRVALAGHSAGGQLALSCTSLKRRARSPRRPSIGVNLRGAIGLAALTDLHAAFADGTGGGAVRSLLGGTPDEHPERYADASPVLLLPHGTRQVLLHGVNDEDVPVSQSRRYAREASRAGDDIECVELAGVEHMDFLDPRSSAHAALCRHLDALLAA